MKTFKEFQTESYSRLDEGIVDSAKDWAKANLKPSWGGAAGLAKNMAGWSAGNYLYGKYVKNAQKKDPRAKETEVGNIVSGVAGTTAVNYGWKKLRDWGTKALIGSVLFGNR